MYLPQQTHVAPLVTVRRDRWLPVPGEVLVRMNQKVTATDVIARTVVVPRHRVLDVARALGISADDADTLFLLEPGAEVKAGEALTKPVGLLRRSFSAPVSGRVVASGGGQVLLEAAAESFELQAGMPGLVVNTEAGLGATIETSGALIQCAWGNGKQNFGVMKMIGEHTRADAELTADQVEASLRGVVLAAGWCADGDALRLAEELNLRGLIFGSLAARLREYAESLSLPILVTEGFGARPMNSPAFELLRTSIGREVAVDAHPAIRYEGHRPEVIIPLPASGAAGLPVDAESLLPGQRIRVLRAPHAGQVGLVLNLSDRRRLLPGGVRAFTADVQLDEAGKVAVPVANLEILE